MRCLFLLFLFWLSGPGVNAQVVINEAGIAPTGPTGSQFIELFNRGGCAVDLGCYTLVFSSTSTGGNPTGWTIKIPSGKTIAAGGYFIIGGTAGTAGVSGGTGYPTSGAVSPYPGAADVNAGTAAITANAVYMKQSLAAGTLPNAKGQITLLDAGSSLVTSVSYNNGNNAGSYPLSAYTTCNLSGNTPGNNNISNPGISPNNINATFSSTASQGFYLSAANTYIAETSLSPGLANTTNGGSQICSGPQLTAVSNGAVCSSSVSQTKNISVAATNNPTTYSITWDALPANSFMAISNAVYTSSTIAIAVPANTAPGNYTGHVTLANTCGSSCNLPFTITVDAQPVVSAGSYGPVCTNSLPISLSGSPTGGIFSGAGVSGNNFIVPSTAGTYAINYLYTNTATGCTNNAATSIMVVAPATSYTTACTTTTPYIFGGQPFSTTGLHTVLTTTANGCTDTAKLYLVVKQTMVTDTTACDSINYNNTWYYNSTSLVQTIQSVVTACDSIQRTVNINIKKSTSSTITACINAGNAYTVAGQTFTATGNYVIHTTNGAGCDSAIDLRLTVTQLQTVDTAGCNSVLYNAIVYTSSTQLIQHIPGITPGCDSIIRKINITVKNATSSVTTRCLSPTQTFLFNGTTYPASGFYSAALTNAAGCDSTAFLRLTIAKYKDTTISGCGTVVYNGIGYTAPATLRDTIKTMAGCDSIIRRTQISVSANKQATAFGCGVQGFSYTFNGTPFNAGGIYVFHYPTQAGCDSAVTLYLTMRQTIMQNFSGCDSVVLSGITYRNSITFRDTIKSILTTCDSIINVKNIIVNKSKRTTAILCLAANTSYNFYGQTISSSGTYTTTLQTTAGCDSLLTLKATVALTAQQNFIGCDSVRYNNKTYYASIVVADTVKGLLTDCDSLVKTTTITVNRSKKSFSTACINGGQTYLFNGQQLTTGGLYAAAFTAAGCDSIAQLYLVVTGRPSIMVQGCNSVVYNSISYTSSTTIINTIPSVVTACDSLVQTVRIVVSPSIHNYMTGCIKSGQSYVFNGQALTSNGSYTAAYTSAGCDSTVHLYLTVANTVTNTLQGCDSLVFRNHFYYTTTQLTDTVKSIVSGCDSLYTVTDINIRYSPLVQSSVCIAEGGSYNFNGQTITASGNYSSRYVRPGLCDSIVYLKAVAAITQTFTISSCGSITYNGVVYTSSALLKDTIKSGTGCDSIYRHTQLFIRAIAPTNVSACVPAGQTYSFNGQTLTASGYYTTTFTSAGCDSVVNLYLTISRTITQNISGCDSALYNGRIYYASTTLSDTARSIVTGCDSVYHKAVITINHSAHHFITACINGGAVYFFNGAIVSTTGTYTARYATTDGCDSIVQLYLVVSKNQPDTLMGCSKVMYHGVSYTTSTVVRDTIKSGVTGCDSLIRITTIQVAQPPVIRISGEGTICKGDSAVLIAKAVGAAITWAGFSTADTLVVSPLVTTIYTVTANANGCTASASATILVQDFALQLTATPNPVLSGAQLQLQSTANSSFTITGWSPAMLFTMPTAKAQRLFPDSTITVSVVGRSSSGCADTASVTIYVNPLDDIYIPSGFTPNGDGRNEEVKVMGPGIKSLDFKVFNRWGQLVFYTTDKYKGWDGKLAGIVQPAGAYVYAVKLVKTNGKIVEKKGTLTLIR